MFAVIKTGGKQYKVAKDDVIAVEKLDAEQGATVELTEVLMVGNETQQAAAGTPFVDGATVAAEVLQQTRSKKIVVFKKKRRKDYRRTHGHRQHVTVLRITDILTDGKKPAKRAAAKKPADAKPEPAAEKPPAEAKPAAKKPAAKKPTAKASTAKKPAAKKPAAKKPAAKKPAAKTTKE